MSTPAKVAAVVAVAVGGPIVVGLAVVAVFVAGVALFGTKGDGPLGGLLR